MAERAYINDIVQVAYEGTAGTQGTAYRRLASTMVVPNLRFDTKTYRAAGNKYPTVVAVNKDWTECRISGPGGWSELCYPLAGISTWSMATVTGTPQAGAYDWTFLFANGSPDAYASYSIQYGQAARSEAFLNGTMRDLTIRANRDEVNFEGAMFGFNSTVGGTLNTAASTVSTDVIVADQVDLYLDTTWAALGGNRLTRALSWEWSITGKQGPLWVVNSSLGSWVAAVELEPRVQLRLMVEADATDTTLLAALRSESTQFIRMLATGGTIAGTAVKTFKLDAAVKLIDRGEVRAEQGVSAVEYTADVVFDATGGTAMVATMRNGLAAL